ncbi:MAG TPA: hypothetical protein DCW83_11850 [Saprospirales bacterium]|jgi:hypothetical protein|nr:hypothetical protein [Saprospirales bacterium]
MTNVIDFSKYRKQRSEEIADLKEDVHILNKKIAQRFSVDVAHDVVSAMSELGYDVTENYESVLDIMVLIESIRALIHRTLGEEYHFQSVSDRIFADSDMDCETALFDFLDEMDESENDPI